MRPHFIGKRVFCGRHVPEQGGAAVHGLEEEKARACWSRTSSAGQAPRTSRKSRPRRRQELLAQPPATTRVSLQGMSEGPRTLHKVSSQTLTARERTENHSKCACSVNFDNPAKPFVGNRGFGPTSASKRCKLRARKSLSIRHPNHHWF